MKRKLCPDSLQVNSDSDKTSRKHPVKHSKSTKTIYDFFSQGDLLYGLTEAREKVNSGLKQKKFHHIYANSLNKNVLEIVVNGEEEPITLDKEESEYLTWLTDYKNYLSALPNKPTANYEEEGSEKRRRKSGAIRRACKLLLNDFPKNKKHFLTSDIDWPSVFDKTNLGITNSEIRSAYRDYLTYGSNPNVLFYDDDLHLTKSPWKNPKIQHHFEEYHHAIRKKR